MENSFISNKIIVNKEIDIREFLNYRWFLKIENWNERYIVELRSSSLIKWIFFVKIYEFVMLRDMFKEKLQKDESKILSPRYSTFVIRGSLEMIRASGLTLHYRDHNLYSARYWRGIIVTTSVRNQINRWMFSNERSSVYSLVQRHEYSIMEEQN